MNYRNTYSKFELSKHLNSHKTQVSDIQNNSYIEPSPRLSNPAEKSSTLYDILNEKPSIITSGSPVCLRSSKPKTLARNLPSSKSTAQFSKISEIEAENKNLKEKVETLQRERDIIKNWKKIKTNSDPQVYKEKLAFLVKNIQNFLQSSTKFQTMLREKMGVSVANMYEEEKNLLKSQLVSATQGYDFPFKFSPVSSPLTNDKSPRMDDLSTVEFDTNRVMDELRTEKKKSQQLQNELSVEMTKNEEGMRSIRDRIVELEKAEKGKVEVEKYFAKSAQAWAIEKLDLQKEIEKYRGDNNKLKEKLSEFDVAYKQMKQGNVLIKNRCEEMIQENFKLSESLQTYDRLYCSSKKWAEKAVDEMKERFEANSSAIIKKLEGDERRIFKVAKGLENLKKKQSCDEGEKLRTEELLKELKVSKERLSDIETEKRMLIEEKTGIFEELKKSEERAGILESKLKKSDEAMVTYEETCKRLNRECFKYSNQFNSLQKEFMLVKSELDGCKGENQDSNKVFTEHQAEIKKFSDDIQLKNNKIIEQNKNIEELEQKIVELELSVKLHLDIESLLEEKNSETEGLAKEKKYYLKKIEQNEAEMKILLLENEKIKKVVNSQENELKKKDAEIDSIRNSLKNFEQKSVESKEAVLIRQQSTFLNENIESLKDQVKLVQFQNLELAEKLNQKDQECQNLESLVEENKNIIKIKEKSLENLKFSLHDHENLINALNSKEQYIQKIESKLKDLSEDIKNKEKLTESLKVEIQSLQSVNETLESRLELLKEIPKLQKEKQKLSESTETYKRQSITLERLLKEKEDLLKIKETSLKDHESIVKRNKQLSEKVSDLIAQNKSSTEQLASLKELRGQLECRDQEILSLKRSLESGQEHKKSIETQHLAIEKTEKDYKDQIEILQVRIGFLINEKESISLTLSEKTEQLTTLIKDFTQLQSQNETLKSQFSLKESQLTSKCEKLETHLNSLNEKLKDTATEYVESNIADKEEISRLNSELVRAERSLSHYKKENSSLSQTVLSLESKKLHCDHCEAYKQKVSELECLIHSAEESLGGFFTNSLIDSITGLIASKTQNLRKAPRPPLLRTKPETQKRQSEEPCPSINYELMNKSPMLSEGSKRSHSSALSLPDLSDLRQELSEEKNENEKYLNQIRLLKEDIRELERKLKRSQDMNEKINSELLVNSLIKLVRALPFQSSDVESIISLVFSIISVPKEELLKLEPERKAKSGKRFGVFNFS